MAEQQSTLEVYGYNIPTTEAFIRNPSPFLDMVTSFADAHRDDLKLISLRSVQEPNVDILHKDKAVLAETELMGRGPVFTYGTLSYYKIQLVARSLQTRIFFEFNQVYEDGKESNESTRLNRELFNHGFPVRVGGLREGPAYRMYPTITGGDLPVNFIEPVEKFGISKTSEKMISEMDNSAIIVKDSQGQVRAWIPPA